MKRHYYTDILIRGVILFFLSIAIGGMITAFCSCRTKKDATEHTIKTEENLRHINRDTLELFRDSSDSIVVHDSVFVIMKGDTVIMNRYHIRDRIKTVYKARAETRIDSLCGQRIETEVHTVIQPLEIEKPLNWWKKTLMFGGLVMTVLLGSWIIKFIRKWRR